MRREPAQPSRAAGTDDRRRAVVPAECRSSRRLGTRRVTNRSSSTLRANASSSAPKPRIRPLTSRPSRPGRRTHPPKMKKPNGGPSRSFMISSPTPCTSVTIETTGDPRESAGRSVVGRGPGCHVSLADGIAATAVVRGHCPGRTLQSSANTRRSSHHVQPWIRAWCLSELAREAVPDAQREAGIFGDGFVDGDAAVACEGG